MASNIVHSIEVRAARMGISGSRCVDLKGFVAMFVWIVIGSGITVSVSAGGAGDLKKQFYAQSCPAAEAVIKRLTNVKILEDPTMSAKLLRMHFHDCFVEGCDASVLLDPVDNSSTTTQVEKQALPNLTLDGFEFYDQVKQQLEAVCPGIVSCADIIALTTRDAISFKFGTDMWGVLTGRRDGKVSLASNAIANLPSPFSNLTTLQKGFSDKGLNLIDLVALSGGHTIGDSHCQPFLSRLYNFSGTGQPDPTLDPTYAAVLRKSCPATNVDAETTVEMDPKSSVLFDTHYFTAVLKNKGLFTSDASLLNDPDATAAIKRFQNSANFYTQFGKSMEKMGRIGVLTGTDGEIRRNCRLVN